ncbi:MAG TPA: zinc ribbon domain-containing protein [Dehalococcoidia bacterium]|nr:zinc ribbon domain-containing protein [Dehalococcoidia bacterium]
MKCPSCGYQNQEGAQYCNMCLYSFIKPHPESRRPKQLQPQTASRERQENPERENVNQQY